MRKSQISRIIEGLLVFQKNGVAIQNNEVYGDYNGQICVECNSALSETDEKELNDLGWTYSSKFNCWTLDDMFICET